jgi:hypothetical protein
MSDTKTFIAYLKHLLHQNKATVVLDVLKVIFCQEKETLNKVAWLRRRCGSVQKDQQAKRITEEKAWGEYMAIDNAIVDAQINN